MGLPLGERPPHRHGVVYPSGARVCSPGGQRRGCPRCWAWLLHGLVPGQGRSAPGWAVRIDPRSATSPTTLPLAAQHRRAAWQHRPNPLWLRAPQALQESSLPAVVSSYLLVFTHTYRRGVKYARRYRHVGPDSPHFFSWANGPTGAKWLQLKEIHPEKKLSVFSPRVDFFLDRG